MHGNQDRRSKRQTESEAHQHIVCGASEPHDADAHAPLYAPYNAFSKKLENRIAAISLHFMYYNFARIHRTLRVTPAMAAGVTDRAWDVEDIVKLLEDAELAEKAAKAHDQYSWKGPALGH